MGDRFRRSAVSVDVHEFLQLIWPTANDEDEALMVRWVQLRAAFNILRSENFHGSDLELRRIFQHLDLEDEGRIPASSLVRAQILPKEEVEMLTGTRDIHNCSLDIER